MLLWLNNKCSVDWVSFRFKFHLGWKKRSLGDKYHSVYFGLSLTFPPGYPQTRIHSSPIFRRSATAFTFALHKILQIQLKETLHVMYLLIICKVFSASISKFTDYFHFLGQKYLLLSPKWRKIRPNPVEAVWAWRRVHMAKAQYIEIRILVRFTTGHSTNCELRTKNPSLEEFEAANLGE